MGVQKRKTGLENDKRDLDLMFEKNRLALSMTQDKLLGYKKNWILYSNYTPLPSCWNDKLKKEREINLTAVNYTILLNLCLKKNQENSVE